MVRNSNLCHAFKEFSIAAESVIESNLKTASDLPYSFVEKFSVSETGYSRFHVKKVDWSFVYGRYEESIKQLPEYSTASKALRQDAMAATHLDQLVGTAEWKTRVDEETILSSLVIQQMEDQDGASFQEGVYYSVYERIEQYFYRDSIKCIACHYPNLFSL